MAGIVLAANFDQQYYFEMRSLISLLLIPIFLFGQGLRHSHAGTGLEQPIDHAERPHVHVSGSHSHGHHHAGRDHAGRDHAGRDHAGRDHAGRDHAGNGHNHGEDSDRCVSPNVSVRGLSCLPIGHDADAIYLASSTGFVGRAVASDQVDDSSDTVHIDYWLERNAQPRPGGRIAPPVRYACVPIYLLIASLRI